jgi:hypothetical protein
VVKPPSTAPSSAANRPILAPAAASLEPQAAVADLPPQPAAAAETSATDTDRPIRKLSPEERARYRLIKNAVVLAICAAVLGALFLALRYAPILKELSGRVELIYELGLRV